MAPLPWTPAYKNTRIATSMTKPAKTPESGITKTTPKKNPAMPIENRPLLGVPEAGQDHPAPR